MSVSLALAALSLPAHAGGIGQHSAAPDPCPPGFVIQNDGTMTADMLRQWAAIRSMSCPEPRKFFDRRTGEQLTDAEILRRIFNGSTIAPIPLPGAAWALLAALGALVVVRGRGRG